MVVARTAHPGIVTNARAEILTTVRSKASAVPGVFTLTVPTGGGKTLASLAFALDHAVTHGLDRVIVVIPFTSIVEQTADVYRAARGPHAGSIVEHHSAFDEDKRRRDDPMMLDKLKLAAENWDARIIVTTAVQFFESLFANRVSKCRKLHNIARSVVVLDEAQTMPVPLLVPTLSALDELARNYSVSVSIHARARRATYFVHAHADERGLKLVQVRGTGYWNAVARRARAWIETILTPTRCLFHTRRSPRASVD